MTEAESRTEAYEKARASLLELIQKFNFIPADFTIGHYERDNTYHLNVNSLTGETHSMGTYSSFAEAKEITHPLINLSMMEIAKQSNRQQRLTQSYLSLQIEKGLM